MKKNFLKIFAMVFVSITMALGCISLVGCGDEPLQVKSISFNKNTLTLMEGEAETLIVTLDPNNASITWTSSDTTKVVVDSNGKVTGISATTSPVIVTATAGDKNATCAVTVTKYVPNYELSPSLLFNADADIAEEKDFEYTEETNLKDNVVYITASSTNSEGKIQKTPKIAVSSGTTGFTFEDNYTYFKSIKTQGKGSINNASIKLVLTKAAKIVLHCRNTSSTTTSMPVSFFNSNYQKIEGQTYDVSNVKDERPALTFTTTQSGTYYIGTETGSLDIYGILIYYEI